jgi:enoyl-CoA hydratase/carnithine racemase
VVLAEVAGAPAEESPDDEPDPHRQEEVGGHDLKVPSLSVAYEALLVDSRDGVATVTINRPERRNALSWAVIGELRAVVAAIKADPEVRVLVLTGAGEKAFCAGADLGGMAAGAGFTELHESRGELAALFLDLYELGKPTIARVRGFALAGGFGLALACDLVVAADDAVFGTPEIDVGLWPYMITVPLVRSLPPKKVLELMMTGRRVDAAEADRLGFVTRVVPVDELDGAVAELAATLAAKSPSVMKLGRDSFYAVWDLAAREALAQLHPMLTVTTLTEDSTEGVAAFAEKRRPRWTGR